MSPSGDDPVACQLCVGRSPLGVSGKIHCQTPSNFPRLPISASPTQEEGIWPKPPEPTLATATQTRQMRASRRMTSSSAGRHSNMPLKGRLIDRTDSSTKSQRPGLVGTSTDLPYVLLLF